MRSETIVGHGKQLRAIARALNTGNVFPVWIFYGPDGVGKTSIAYKFAKCLLAGADSVNEDLNLPSDHPVRTMVNKQIHPDFFVMKQSSMDEARSLMNKVRKAPSVSERRVVLIENADDFNKNVSNSLLKILEEPPRGTVFIMVCSNLGGLPITVLSRAAKLRFNPLSEAEVVEALRLSGIDDGNDVAKIADGSVGDAIYLHENEGVALYNNILNAFAWDYETSCKTVRYVIENNISFKLVKRLIIRALRTYIACIVKAEHHELFENFSGSVDREAKKALQIIADLNIGESLLLDKNAMIAGVFETFFEESLQ